MKFFVHYTNDVGPNDDYFVEMWQVMFGNPEDGGHDYRAKMVIQLYDEKKAKLLAEILNTRITPSETSILLEEDIGFEKDYRRS